MLDEAVGERYAEALFALAQQDGKVLPVRQELEQVAALVDKDPALGRALRAPTVADAVKKSILRDVFGKGLSPLTVNFLMVLVENRRTAALTAVVARFHELEQEAEGEITARVEVALDPPADVKDKVQREVSAHTGRKAHLDWVQNPEILGGVVVRIKDRLIDYSLRKQLNDLRERLLQAQA